MRYTLVGIIPGYPPERHPGGYTMVYHQKGTLVGIPWFITLRGTLVGISRFITLRGTLVGISRFITLRGTLVGVIPWYMPPRGP